MEASASDHQSQKQSINPDPKNIEDTPMAPTDKSLSEQKPQSESSSKKYDIPKRDLKLIKETYLFFEQSGAISKGQIIEIFQKLAKGPIPTPEEPDTKMEFGEFVAMVKENEMLDVV